MRRFSEWWVWVPVVALLAAFVAGLLVSLLVPEPRPHVDPLEFLGR